MSATDDLAAWLTQIWNEDQARLSHVTFCGPVWPTTEQLLARIAADGQILALHASLEMHYNRLECAACGIAGEFPVRWPCKTLRLLALPHADRPGYREEWKP